MPTAVAIEMVIWFLRPFIATYCAAHEQRGKGVHIRRQILVFADTVYLFGLFNEFLMGLLHRRLRQRPSTLAMQAIPVAADFGLCLEAQGRSVRRFDSSRESPNGRTSSD